MDEGGRGQGRKSERVDKGTNHRSVRGKGLIREPMAWLKKGKGLKRERKTRKQKKKGKKERELVISGS